MTNRTEHGPDDVDMARLDHAVSAARAAPPDPSAALMARVLADALAAQPAPARRHAARPVGALRRLWAGSGGWPSCAALSTAAVAGVWLGISPPDTVLMLTDALALTGGPVSVPEGTALLATYLGEG